MVVKTRALALVAVFAAAAMLVTSAEIATVPAIPLGEEPKLLAEAIEEPAIIFGYTYDSDGTTLLPGCTIVVKDANTGQSVTTESSPDNAAYMVSMYQTNIGDVINVTATHGAQIGWSEGPAPPALQYVWINVSLTVTRTVFELDLVAGWNFVSVPVITGYRASTLPGLSAGDVVVQWDTISQIYRTFIIGMPIFDFEIKIGHGYWIYASAAKTLTLLGIAPETPQSRAITVPAGGGWAQIGIGQIGMKASELVSMYSGGSVTMVIGCSKPGYEPLYVAYAHPLPLNDFTLVPGGGYYIFVTGSGTLTIPYEAPVDSPPVASFTYRVDGLKVYVDASSSTDDVAVAGYQWNWGDGSLSSGVAANHTYVSIPPAAPQASAATASGAYMYQVYGYVYGPDGSPAGKALVVLKNLRTGISYFNVTDPDFGIFLFTFFGEFAAGDGMNFTAICGGAVGYIEDTARPSDGMKFVEITLSTDYPVPTVSVTVTLAVTDTAGQTSYAEKEISLVPGSA